MIFIQNLVEYVYHYALSHATFQNNPYVILFSVTRVCVFKKNRKTPQIPSMGGQVNIFNHFLETITFFSIPWNKNIPFIKNAVFFTGGWKFLALKCNIKQICAHYNRKVIEIIPELVQKA